jgi:hypothetical protein
MFDHTLYNTGKGKGKGKGKAIQLQPCTSRRGSRRLRHSEFLDNMHMNVVRFSPYVPAAFTPQEISFSEAESMPES